MMLLAGASRTAVPVPPGCPAALPLAAPGAPKAPEAAEAAAGADAWPGAAAVATEPEAADELLALFAEHPAMNDPPASMVPPSTRPAVSVRRPVRLDRRFRLGFSAMPL
jgi:hypothetical protein